MTATIDLALEPRLTPVQWDAFDREGFLVMRQLASAERIAAMRTLTLEHLEHGIAPIEYEADVAYPGAPASRSAAGGDTPRRLLQAFARDPVLAAWATDDRLTAIIVQLLESRDVWMTPNHHNCVMTKHPQFSTATAWHRDLRYWSFETPRLVNAWLALGDETRANGCMQLIPGSHRLSIGPDRMDENAFLRADHPDNADMIASAVEATLSPGDVLFFDAGVFHAAGANTTDTLKLAMVASYFGADNAPVAGTRSAAAPAIQVRESSHDTARDGDRP